MKHRRNHLTLICFAFCVRIDCWNFAIYRINITIRILSSFILVYASCRSNQIWWLLSFTFSDSFSSFSFFFAHSLIVIVLIFLSLLFEYKQKKGWRSNDQTTAEIDVSIVWVGLLSGVGLFLFFLFCCCFWFQIKHTYQRKRCANWMLWQTKSLFALFTFYTVNLLRRNFIFTRVGIKYA